MFLKLEYLTSCTFLPPLGLTNPRSVFRTLHLHPCSIYRRFNIHAFELLWGAEAEPETSENKLHKEISSDKRFLNTENYSRKQKTTRKGSKEQKKLTNGWRGTQPKSTSFASPGGAGAVGLAG